MTLKGYYRGFVLGWYTNDCMELIKNLEKTIEMNETEINLENFTAGVYTFNVYANDTVKVVRIIKN